MKEAKRMQHFSSGVFNELERKKRQLKAAGVDVIDLGVGSPDLPPAQHIVEALCRAARKTSNYSYALTGLGSLHEAVAALYQKRFNVALDPASEVLVLMGSQDGLAHLSLAFIDPGDIALVPDPGYPVYSFSILMAQGEIYPVPLLSKNNFLPQFSEIPEDIAQSAKLLWLNYPNNPAAATADREFFYSAVEFARKNDILICHDVAYAELAYDNYKPVSLLEIPGAKEIGVEFYSLSKTYNMAGCRIGFALGNSSVLNCLATIKSNIDYGVFYAIQEAGIAALTGPQDCVSEAAKTYQKRRDVLVAGMSELNWEMPKPNASMFVWAPLPPGYSSSTLFASELLDKAGIVVTPGVAFGEQGEGYVRIALVKDERALLEAVQRIALSFNFN